MELTVDVGIDPDADASELDEVTRELRRELLELDVEDVERPASGPPPEGTRAVEAALLGTLLVSVGQEAITAVVRTLAGWLRRRPSRKVTLRIGDDEIELTDASEQQQAELVAAFLARNGATAG